MWKGLAYIIDAGCSQPSGVATEIVVVERWRKAGWWIAPKNASLVFCESDVIDYAGNVRVTDDIHV